MNDHFFDYEKALSELLKADIVSVLDSSKDEIIISANSNDLFVPAADGHCLKFSEIKGLYEFWLVNKQWGNVIWLSVYHKEKPREKIVKMMKEQNSWSELMENLPENIYEKSVRKKYNQNAKN